MHGWVHGGGWWFSIEQHLLFRTSNLRMEIAERDLHEDSYILTVRERNFQKGMFFARTAELMQTCDHVGRSWRIFEKFCKKGFVWSTVFQKSTLRTQIFMKDIVFHVGVNKTPHQLYKYYYITINSRCVVTNSSDLDFLFNCLARKWEISRKTALICEV